MSRPSRSCRSSIMRNRVVAYAIGCASLAYGTMIALSIYAPVYFETVLGLSASGAGLTLIPFMGGVVIGSTFGGRLMAQAHALQAHRPRRHAVRRRRAAADRARARRS